LVILDNVYHILYRFMVGKYFHNLFIILYDPLHNSLKSLDNFTILPVEWYEILDFVLHNILRSLWCHKKQF